MAKYKFVNTEQLDSDLTTIADKIREKANITGKLDFPSGFVTAVENSASVQISRGTVSVRSGSGTVNCGFQPDFVALVGLTYTSSSTKYEVHMAYMFSEKTTSNTCEIAGWDQDVDEYYAIIANTATGFSLTNFKQTVNNSSSNVTKTFNYVAVKYT